MHRGVRENLEDILAGADSSSDRHLRECAECSAEIESMREHGLLLRGLRAGDVEPRPGFYARVLERIEAQAAAVSVWNLFFESPAGRALAMASMVVALSLSAYLITSEQGAPPIQRQEIVRGAGGMLTGSPDRDAVLVNLVTYRGQ